MVIDEKFSVIDVPKKPPQGGTPNYRFTLIDVLSARKVLPE
jgi:hypothetical protein